MVNRTIWKYALPLSGSKSLQMPAGSVVLSVANQDEQLVLWAIVDTVKKDVSRQFKVCLTGGTPPDNSIVFVGTVLFDSGSYVVHVFEVQAS